MYNSLGNIITITNKIIENSLKFYILSILLYYFLLHNSKKRRKAGKMKGEEGSSKRNCHLMRITKIYLPKKISNSTFISIRPPMKEGILQAILQFSSVTQSCPTLWPHGCSMPGLPVHHQLPEFTQTHAHWVGDAIQLSHPLLSPSTPAFNLSQHQGFFKWVSSLHQVIKVLAFQLQHQSFQWTLKTDLL